MNLDKDRDLTVIQSVYAQQTQFFHVIINLFLVSHISARIKTIENLLVGFEQ